MCRNTDFVMFSQMLKKPRFFLGFFNNFKMSRIEHRFENKKKSMQVGLPMHALCMLSIKNIKEINKLSFRDSPGSISEGFGAFGASVRQLWGVPGLLPNVSWMLLGASWALLGPLGHFLGPSWTIHAPPEACRDPLREAFGYRSERPQAPPETNFPAIPTNQTKGRAFSALCGSLCKILPWC